MSCRSVACTVEWCCLIVQYRPPKYCTHNNYGLEQDEDSLTYDWNCSCAHVPWLKVPRSSSPFPFPCNTLGTFNSHSRHSFPPFSPTPSPTADSCQMSEALWVVAGLVSAASSVRAQVSCENYGSPLNSSACTCPPGFGGPTCSAPACGGNIFQAHQRPLISGANSTSFGNVSSSTCACPAGWTGTGCNVCQGSTVCQSAFNAAGGSISDTNPEDSGLNNTLTCNTAPRVYAAGEMSCSVIVRGPPYSGASHIIM